MMQHAIYRYRVEVKIQFIIKNKLVNSTIDLVTINDIDKTSKLDFILMLATTKINKRGRGLNNARGGQILLKKK